MNFLFTLLTASLLQTGPLREALDDSECPAMDYVELSRPSPSVERKICVSPGVVTNVIFDLPAEVEFQEELRFMSILHDRNEISFRPPRDLAAGESLRLMVKLGTGEVRQEVTFFLVAHPGQATHQVEVYHDTRPRESLLHEVAEEHARNQRLQEENQRLRTEMAREQASLHRMGGLADAYLSGVLSHSGITAAALPLNPMKTDILVSEAFSYQSDTSIAIEATVTNNSPEEWTAIGASLLDATGRPLLGVVLAQTETIAPQSQGKVFLEAAAPHAKFGTYTLNLMENGTRTVSLPQVVFPH